MKLDPEAIARLAPIIAAGVAATVALTSLFFQRTQERLAVNRAILAEVSRLFSVIRRHREWWESCRASSKLNLPLIEFSTTVYDKLSDKLGLVHPVHIAAVVSFYGFVKFINNLQKTREQYDAPTLSDTFAPFYAKSLRQAERFESSFSHAFAKYGVCAPGRQPVLGDDSGNTSTCTRAASDTADVYPDITESSPTPACGREHG